MIVFNGKSLRTVKKAPYRDIEPPIEMYKYIMFSHIGEYGRLERKMPRLARVLPTNNAEAAKAYLDGKTSLRELGHALQSKLVDQLQGYERDRERIIEAREVEECMDIVSKELGINYWERCPENYMARINELKSTGITPRIAKEIKNLLQAAQRMEELVEKEA